MQLGARQRLASVVPFVVAAGVLAWAGPRPGDLPRSSGELSRLLAHGSVDGTTAILAGLAAELCVLYLLLTAILVGCSQLPGLTGRLAGALTGRLVPAFLRRAVEATLGIAVATASVSAPAAPALAAGTAGPRPSPTSTAAAPPAARTPGPPLPSLDRPEGPPQPRARPPVTPGQILTPGRAVVDVAVVVRRGDSLWRIAARHLGPQVTEAQVAAAWPRWYAANRAVVGPDPNLLLPGQRLIPPR